MSADPSLSPPAASGPSRREFVLMVAALMAANALAIDSMLPALPAIAGALDLVRDNDRQWVITAYLLGFGLTQLAYGPLADRFGRRKLLLLCLSLYAVFGALAGIAGSFNLLLAARFMQGGVSAGIRVLAIAVIRDRYHGPAMAQIMSTAMIIFMLVPLLAPSFGQAILAVASWRYIFIVLAFYALGLFLWIALRLPETLAEEHRLPLSAAHVGRAVAETLRTRQSIGNTLASCIAFGGLFAFIGSIQQIVFDVFHAPALIGIVFALVAGPMALSSYANSRLVMRVGPRRLLLRALVTYTTISLVHLAVALAWGENLWSFILLQAMTLACFGLVGANSSALAMEPLGHIAGTAAAFQGGVSTVGGGVIGLVIGQMFDGTTIPMIAGFAICGVVATAVAWWANHERLEKTAAPQDEGAAAL
jgi:DHA1 family bicyclomycin/chloramphenicol resistance-like MFS transporter